MLNSWSGSILNRPGKCSNVVDTPEGEKLERPRRPGVRNTKVSLIESETPKGKPGGKGRKAERLSPPTGGQDHGSESGRVGDTKKNRREKGKENEKGNS